MQPHAIGHLTSDASIASPTAGIVAGTIGSPLGSGEKSGVVTVSV